MRPLADPVVSFGKVSATGQGSPKIESRTEVDIFYVEGNLRFQFMEVCFKSLLDA